MKNLNQINSWLAATLVAFTPVVVSAADFDSADENGNTIYYKKGNPGQVAVTFKGGSSMDNTYEGNIVIPSKVKHGDIVYDVVSIDGSAFAHSKDLLSVTIPTSVTEIGSFAFWYCPSLETVYIPGSVTTIGDEAFNNSGLITVTIPSSVTELGISTFSHCERLKSVEISNSVTELGYNIFGDCKNLTSVNIPNSIEKIDNYAFSGCTGLTEVTIPGSVTHIGTRAFSGCSCLNSVTVDNADPANISVANDIFSMSSVSECTLYVPKGSKELYEAAYQWKDFGTIEELASEEVPIFGDLNGDGKLSIADVVVLVNLILQAK